MTRTTPQKRWRIGELAKATGLTVRTLHHYEQVGLLPPPTRSGGRHRLYDARDVQRLYRVLALRELGLSLEEIGRTLDRERARLGDVLRRHLETVSRELTRLSRLRDRLENLCAHADDRVNAEELLATIEAMNRVVAHAEGRRARGEDPKDAEARWRELGVALRALMDAGAAPRSARVKAVARRIREALLAFTGGDPGLLEDLARLRTTTRHFDHAGWDPPLLEFMDRALAALEEEG